MTGILRGPRRIALGIIAALVAGATAASFAESYRALLLWAHGHGVPGFWAAAWPLQVDAFIAVGELALFVALLDRWSARSRLAAWATTAAGLAVSVAGNVGHVHGPSLTSRATAAVPPLAAAAALAVGLGVLKRVVAMQSVQDRKPPVPEVPATVQEAARAAYAASVRGGNPLSERALADRFGITRPQARKLRAEVAAEADGSHAAEESIP